MLLLTLLAVAGLGSGWPSFRGDNGSGVSESTSLPVELGPSKNLVWQAALPPGKSSPVLAGDKIFLTAMDGTQLLTICLRRSDGKILWRQPMEQTRKEDRHNLNHAASATPVTDGKNVFAFFSDFGLVSYGADGNRRWTYALDPFHNLHGMGTSPILAGDALILVCDQDTGSFILAVHKDTGKLLWRTERAEIVHGFSTPTLFKAPSGEQQVIIPTSYMLVSYSVENGQELWRVRGLTWQLKTLAVVSGGTIYATGWAPGADPGQANPVPAFEEVLAEIDTNKDGLLAPAEITPKYKHSGSWQAIDLDHDGFLNARDWSFFRARRSSSNVTMAVRPGDARGDLTQTHVLWRNDRFVPQVSSPLLYRDVLYTIKDGGILTSLNPSTGETYKTARVPGALDNYYSSPVAADGKLYLASETGKVSVIRAHRDWEVLAVNDFDEPIYATPAIDGNRIYLRTAGALYCFASAGQASPEKR